MALDDKPSDAGGRCRVCKRELQHDLGELSARARGLCRDCEADREAEYESRWGKWG